MSKSDQDDPLSRSLEKFETCLETPVVPGELPQWCRAAATAGGEVDRCLRRQIRDVHPGLFAQILGEDPELAARVDALEQADHDLVAQMDRVNSLLERLSPTASAVEPDESRVDQFVESAIDSGLQLVLAVRKQETAITTWFMESLDRDRGEVD